MTTASKETRTIEGKLLEVNWHNGTAQLHTDEGVVQLAFSEELAADFKRLAREEVRATGLADNEDEGKAAAMAVEELAATHPRSSFWEPLDIERLIKEQGVKPFDWDNRVTDPDPDPDFDIDKWLAEIRDRPKR